MINGAQSYEVYSSIMRNPENPNVRGGVEVLKNGQPIASVLCDAGRMAAKIDALHEMPEAAVLYNALSFFGWDKCN